jgi:hypothetical protein
VIPPWRVWSAFFGPVVLGLALGSFCVRANTSALQSSGQELGPGQAVRSYVSAVHRGAERSAYAWLAPGISYRKYRNMAAVGYSGALQQLEVGPFRIRVGQGTYTCIGVQQANSLPPDKRPMRGWYVVGESTANRWGVVFHGSDLQAGAPFFVPSRNDCSAVVTGSGNVRECAATQVRATAWLQGAGGTRVGLLSVHKVRHGTCALKGFPSLTLNVSWGGGHLRLIAKRSPGTANTGLLGTNAPGAVLLPVGYAASASLQWSNWCYPYAGSRDQLTLSLNSVAIPVAFTTNAGLPPCLSKRRSSIFSVEQFEPLSPS